MNKNRIWISINSFLAFVSAFIFLKAVIVLARFVVMRHFGGSTQMENFEIECITWMYSSFWTQTSVVSIYLIGFIVALFLIIAFYALYRRFRTVRGFLKLWFAWLYVFAVNQSIGAFLRDIPFKRDIYHALNWLYIPYGVMIAMAVFSIALLFALNYGNDIKFLRMSPSFDSISSNRQRRRFYTRVALLPAIFGSAFILLLHFNNINLFEIVEKLLIIFAVVVAYLQFSKEDLIIEFRIVKNEPSEKPGILLIALFALSLYGFLFLKNIYF
ncbi:MAG: hypothetical protein JXR36_14670 [Bacteroidales bacterium]|nr:hypothetical protein [Bacteroidales bacterium]